MILTKKTTENYNGTNIIFEQDKKGFFWLDFNYFVVLTEGLYDYETLLYWIKENKQFANNFYSYHNMGPGCRGLTLSFNEYGIISCLLELGQIELCNAAAWVASILQSYRFPPSPAGIKYITIQPEFRKTIQNKNLDFFSDRQNQLWARLTDVCNLFNVEPETIYGYYLMNPDDYSPYLSEKVTGKFFDDFTGVNEYGIIAMPLLINDSPDVINTVIQLANIIKSHRLINLERSKEVSI